MNREYRNRYYHGGLGAEENRREWDRATRDGDYGPDHELRFRKNVDSEQEDYRRHDSEMEHNYYRYAQGDHHRLDDIRQGYGYSSFERDHDRNDEVSRMKRERANQPDLGYGSGIMGGYSGSSFGGSNYSVHGSFGGSPDYGSMSGYGGNANNMLSSSGYGGGHLGHNTDDQYYRGSNRSDNYSQQHVQRPEHRDWHNSWEDNDRRRYYRNRDEQGW
jgi:hypothetical protein